jgi:hypothetical protein
MSSGQSEITKVIAVRVPNKEHSMLIKKAGGKKKLTMYIQLLLKREALS